MTSKTVEFIILDIEMPKMSGVEATQIIRKIDKDVRIIIVTGHDEDSYISKMIDEKANSYLLKDSKISEIYQAIKSCMEIGFYFPDYVKNALFNKQIRKSRLNPKETKPYIHISEREMEVLRLICEEKTTAQIAKDLYISPRTVDGHKAKLLEKTNTKNMVGLVLFCYRNHIISSV